MRSHLVDDGRGGWKLNAYKNYVTGGHHAAACLVWTRFPGGDGAKGIGAVVVDLSAPGVSVTSIHKKMGLRGCAEAELAFDDVPVTPDDVLLPGEPGSSEAFKTLLSHLNHERCGNAAMCLGAAQGALEHAIRYMNERVVGGRAARRPPGPAVEDRGHGDAARGRAACCSYRAVALAGPHGTPPALETAMAKAASNLAAKFVCDEAIQLLGGYGYSREYPVERMYRDIRGLCIGAGTVEVQRNYVGANLLRGRTPAGGAWRNPLTLDADPLLRPTLTHRRAADYRRPGGPWDGPTLDGLPWASRRRDAGRRRGRARRRRCGRSGSRRGDVVAWQLPNSRRRAPPLPRLLAPGRHRRAHPPPRGSRPTSNARWRTLDPRLVHRRRARAGATARSPTRRRARVRGRGRRDVAVVLFTSGSTGTPKAALHTHRGLAWKARLMTAGARARPGRRGADARAAGPHLRSAQRRACCPARPACGRCSWTRWDPDARAPRSSSASASRS